MDIKQRIARQFSRAAEKYDASAIVQADIAFDAVQMLGPQYGRILDIGCGTGRVTRVLADKGQQTCAIDIAEGMLKVACANTKKPIQWLAGDAEALPFQQQTFDLVFSTMALQWCDNPQQVMREIHRVLKSKGQGLLAIMGDGSFSELNRSWHILDKRPHTNRFPTEGNLAVAASRAGLEVKSNSKSYLTWHSNIRELLGSIKSIGANIVTNNGNHSPLNRSTLDDLQEIYHDLFAQEGRLPLTYNVCFLHLKKT